MLNSATLSLTLILKRPHNCNKTKIKEFYKSYRTLAADQVLLDIYEQKKFAANDSVAL